MGTTKKRIIMNAFFKSQFNYCPLVWMCCNRSLNTKINQLHEWCLWIVYNDKESNFNELLVKYCSVSIHHQNLQKLAVEIFKVSRGLSPEIVNYFNSESKYLTNWDKGLSFKSLGFIQFLVVQRALNFLGWRYVD